MEKIALFELICLMFYVGYSYGDENCSFSGLILHCDTRPDLLTQLTVYAIVNYCNRPVDVTFGLRDVNGTWSWEHTFVNADETQPLRGLAENSRGLPEDLKLHVSLETLSDSELFVQANLVLNNDLVTPFVDEEVSLPPCQTSDNANVYLPLVIFIILLVLILVLVCLIISYRRERHRKTAQLLSNMDGVLGTAPYQEEPIQTEYTDDPNYCTTVIRNDIYRDSLLLDPDSTCNGIIVAYKDSNIQDGRHPIYNPRTSKRTRKVPHNSDLREEEVILRVQDINQQPNNHPPDSERY